MTAPAAATPGRISYEATVAQAVIDGHGIGEYPAYDDLEPWQRGRWEAGAMAAIDAEPDFATAFHDDAAEGREKLAALRELVAEILGRFHYLHQDFMECDITPDEYAKWRERAGLET